MTDAEAERERRDQLCPRERGRCIVASTRSHLRELAQRGLGVREVPHCAIDPRLGHEGCSERGIMSSLACG